VPCSILPANHICSVHRGMPKVLQAQFFVTFFAGGQLQWLQISGSDTFYQVDMCLIHLIIDKDNASAALPVFHPGFRNYAELVCCGNGLCNAMIGIVKEIFNYVLWRTSGVAQIVGCPPVSSWLLVKLCASQ